MSILLNILKWYNPTNVEKIKEKKETLINAERLYNNRNNVIKVFKKGIFLYTDGFEIEQESEEESDEESEEELEKEIKNILKEFNKCIEEESKDINYYLFKEFLIFQYLVPWQKNSMK